MTTQLSVLIVEDSASDAGLMIRYLQRAGFDLIHARVETVAQMRDALLMQAWDLVLCDFTLPGFD
ncbi:MAG TPA: histidine kinase, partial [Rhodocyclaceae bacterium]|nr:histidine kinase [Rhodocyclaceae bacterium]